MSLDPVVSRAAILTALARTLDKWADRDALPDGSAFKISAEITGTCDGHPFALPVDTMLCVGHESTRKSSVTPCVAEVLAAALGAVAVLADVETAQAVAAAIVSEFAASGAVEVDAEFVDLAESTLASLRGSVDVTARGAVKCQASTKQAEFAEVA